MNAMEETARGLLWQGQLDQSLNLYKIIHQMTVRDSGSDHPDTASALHSMANVLYKQKKFPEALQSLKDSLKIRKAHLGEEHPITIATIQNIVLIHVELGNMTEAIKLSTPLESILAKKKEIQNKKGGLGIEGENSDAREKLFKKAKACGKKGLHEEALEFYKEIHEMNQNEFGQDDENTIYILTRIGRLYYTQGKLDEALQHYERAHEGLNKLLGPDHPETLSTMKNISKLLANQKKDEEASKMLHDVYGVQIKTLGTEHKESMSTLNNLMVLRKREQNK